MALTWATFRANHPEVLASWGEQNGRDPKCRCHLCGPHHDTLPVPAGPDEQYMRTMRDAAATAVRDRAGVALWQVLTQIRNDGHPALADDITRDLVDRLVARAATDPELFARLLHLHLEGQ